LVLSPKGKLLGRLVTGESIANIAWGNDGSVLYLTSDMYLCRIQTKTKGTGFWIQTYNLKAILESKSTSARIHVRSGEVASSQQSFLNATD